VPPQRAGPGRAPTIGIHNRSLTVAQVAVSEQGMMGVKRTLALLVLSSSAATAAVEWPFDMRVERVDKVADGFRVTTTGAGLELRPSGTMATTATSGRTRRAWGRAWGPSRPGGTWCSTRAS